ncbi:hypothetical protein WA577_005534, partial [Blastocystis sp. JDR]
MESKKIKTAESSVPFDKTNRTYLTMYNEDKSIAARLSDMRIFPNDKEVTEAMAAYAHTKKYVIPEMTDKPAEGDLKDAILCVGDGSTPRSAALFALHFPSWECYSIDPQLKEV